jgi:surfeit locus 1 family protein
VERRAALDAAPEDISSGPIPEDIVGASVGGSGAMRRVSVAGGVLQPERAIKVGPRPPPPDTPTSLLAGAQAGYMTVMPLQRADGSRILVQLGWTPADVYDREQKGFSAALLAQGQVQGGASASAAAPAASGWFSRSSAAPASTASPSSAPSSPRVSVTGVLRPSETPGSFAPTHSPERGIYTFFDVPVLAAACGLKVGAGEEGSKDYALLLEAVEPLVFTPAAAPASSATAAAASAAAASVAARPVSSSPFPLPRPIASLYDAYVMPSTHLIYAGTWYTLAVVAASVAMSKGRRR